MYSSKTKLKEYIDQYEYEEDKKDPLKQISWILTHNKSLKKNQEYDLRDAFELIREGKRDAAKDILIHIYKWDNKNLSKRVYWALEDAIDALETLGTDSPIHPLAKELGKNYRLIVLEDDDTEEGGVSFAGETLGDFLDEVDEDESDEAAAALARKLLKRYSSEADERKAMQKLLAAMARRGYGYEASKRAVETALEQMDD